jgi:hypothetical protein
MKVSNERKKKYGKVFADNWNKLMRDLYDDAFIDYETYLENLLVVDVNIDLSDAKNIDVNNLDKSFKK